MKTHLFRSSFFRTPDSIRLRLVVVFILAIAPLAGLSVTMSALDYGRRFDALEQDFLRTTALASEPSQRVLESAVDMLQTLAAQEPVRSQTPGECRSILRSIKSAFPQLLALVIVDLNGRLTCADNPDYEGLEVGARPWFRAIVDRRSSVFGDLSDSPLIGARTVKISIPVRNQNGRMTGVIAAFLAPNWLAASSPQIEISNDALLVLAGLNGEIVPIKGAYESGPYDQSSFLRLIAPSDPSASIRHLEDGTGQAYVVAVSALQYSGLRFAFAQPTDSYFGWTRWEFAGAIAIPLLILAATLLVAWIAGNRLCFRWLVYLQHFARIYGAGRYSVRPRIPEAAPVEVRDLGTTFSHVMDEITRRDRALKDELSYREVLIREVNHRVKNNLQIIASLLNVQARRLTNEAARDTIQDLRQRVDALALIHRDLYGNDDLRRLSIAGGLGGLSMYLAELAANNQKTIAFDMEIAERRVSPDTVIAIAMLITEAFIDARHRTSKGSQESRIVVQLKENVDGSATLTIADNGLPNNGPAPRRFDDNGFGQVLMEGFARQLGGILSIESTDRTTVRVEIADLR